MNVILDNLFARRPKIHYVCPPICGVQFVPTSSGAPSISFEPGSALGCVDYSVANNVLSWTDFPGAICYNIYMGPPPVNPDDGLPPCVNYFLTNETIISSQFTWEPYPLATSYNVYRSFPDAPSKYVRTQSNIPVSTLDIDGEHVIVTAVTPAFETPTCAPIYYVSPCSPELADWLARVDDEVPLLEQLAVCQFIADMKAAALWDKMYSVNHFSPTSKQAAYTWLKAGQMSDTWAWNNPALEVDRDVTVNGFDNAGDYADSGVAVNGIYSLTNCGITGYASQTNSDGAFSDILGAFCGGYDAPNQDAFSLHPWKRYTVDPVFGYTTANCWKFDPGIVPASPLAAQLVNKGCGFLSLSRADINNAYLYYGASNSPLSLLASTNTSSDNVPPTSNMQLFTFQSNTYLGRSSFLSLHEALTAAETATFFSIVQNFRIALGGGYV